MVNVVSNILESVSESDESYNASFDTNASTAIINSLETQASLALDTSTDFTVIESNVALSGVILDNESVMMGGIGFGIQIQTGTIKGGFGNNSTRTYRMLDEILNDSPDAYIYIPQLNNTNGKTTNY